MVKSVATDVYGLASGAFVGRAGVPCSGSVRRTTLSDELTKRPSIQGIQALHFLQSVR